MLFCKKHDIEVKCMDDIYQEQGRARRGQEEKTNLHKFRVEIFNTVINLLINELNNRFNERNTELLLCVACLNPSDGFASFNKEKLVQLAQLYPFDFSRIDIERLGSQLNTDILNVREVPELKFVKGISGLAQKLVELKQDRVYFLVYRLLKLALLLPVATASVERVFSAMNIIISRLRNRIGNDFINDCLVAYIERDIVNQIDNETIMKRFQCICLHRGTLCFR